MNQSSLYEQYYTALQSELAEPEMELLQFQLLSQSLANAWHEAKGKHPLKASALHSGIHLPLAEEIMAKPLTRDFKCMGLEMNADESVRGAYLMAGIKNLAMGRMFSLEQAVNLVLDAFTEFHPEIGKAARAVVDQGRIDFTPNLAGARCYLSVPDARNICDPDSAQKVKSKFRHLSFVSASLKRKYNGKYSVSDVITIAHEIAHAVANDLAADAQIKEQRSMPLHEAFAAFGERLAVKRLLEETKFPYQRYLIARQYCHNLNFNLTQGMYARLFNELIDHTKVVDERPDLDKVQSLSKSVFQNHPAQYLINIAPRAQWRFSHYITNEPYYALAYVLGEAASQSFFNCWREGGTTEKEKLAEMMLKIMKGNPGQRGYAAIPHSIGLSPREPNYLQNSLQSLDYYDRLACAEFETAKNSIKIQREQWAPAEPPARRGQPQSSVDAPKR